MPVKLQTIEEGDEEEEEWEKVEGTRRRNEMGRGGEGETIVGVKTEEEKKIIMKWRRGEGIREEER